MSITKTHRKFKPMLAGKGSSRSDRLNISSDQTFLHLSLLSHRESLKNPCMF